MRNVSNRFLAAIRTNHQIAVRGTLVSGDDEYDLPVADGTVTLDINSAIRASLDLTLALGSGDDLLPTSASDPLTPFGSEILIDRGVVYSDGTVEYVRMGRFRIDRVDVEATGGDTTVSVSAFDRSILLSEATFETSGTIAAGANAVEKIEELALEAYGGLPLNLGSTTVTLPALVYGEGEDRLDFLKGIAEACGSYLYFDADGALTRRSLQGNQEPVQTFTSETLTSVSRSWVREGAANRIVVTGENSTDDPFRAVKVDDDPDSPTYYYARLDGDRPPFGKQTFEYSSEFINDSGDAGQVAENLLDRKKGLPQTVSFSCLPNPALEPLDVVRVEHEELGIDELVILDAVTIPLSTDGEMSVQTRLASTTFGSIA